MRDGELMSKLRGMIMVWRLLKVMVPPDRISEALVKVALSVQCVNIDLGVEKVDILPSDVAGGKEW